MHNNLKHLRDAAIIQHMGKILVRKIKQILSKAFCKLVKAWPKQHARTETVISLFVVYFKVVEKN